VVVPDVAARIDAIVAEVAFTGWRESIAGDRAVRKELRGVLKQFALPVTGDCSTRRRHETWDDWGGLDPQGDWPEQGLEV
jgi:hypothetical protein